MAILLFIADIVLMIASRVVFKLGGTQARIIGFALFVAGTICLVFVGILLYQDFQQAYYESLRLHEEQELLFQMQGQR